MKSLYNQFGDWYLAMAAYDWGPGNVQRAVMRTGYADFWELYRRNVLPGETKNYVPGIIAAIIMAKNPEQYGLDKIVPDSPVISDTVTVDYPIDLRLVADVTECFAAGDRCVESEPASDDHATGYALRSAYSCGNAMCSQTRIKEIPEDKRSSWRFHVVKAGESLDIDRNCCFTRERPISPRRKRLTKERASTQEMNSSCL